MLTIRFVGALFILTFSMLGCGTGAIGSGGPKKIPPGHSPSGPLDFAWKLSGDRLVAPLQVFSDASHTWLQWLPNQTLPAIFGVTDAGEQLAAYDREGPYAKLEGRWTMLVFRGGTLQARARRVQASAAYHATPARLSNPPSEKIGNSPSTQSNAQAMTPPKASVLAQPIAHTSQPFYAVTSTDKNLRQTLARWSGLSGWRFQAEHWAVDVDIPLTATANFSDDFVGSVRALVEATELSERPLQPCFYANQVLRVVPINEACDRTVVEGTKV